MQGKFNILRRIFEEHTESAQKIRGSIFSVHFCMKLLHEENYSKQDTKSDATRCHLS